MQSKHPKKSTRRGHKRSTGRGTRKDQTKHQERCRKTPLGDSLSTAKLANFGCPCRRVRFAKKNTKGAPERPEVLPKRSTSKSESTNEAPESKPETTKGAPERPEVLPKRSASKSNQRAQMKHQKVNQRPQQEHQRDQRFCQKRSTSKSNQRAQMKHQKVQSETTKGAPERPECQNGAPASPIREQSTIRDHKRSTRGTRGCTKTEHQQIQSEITNKAPESTIRDHKRSTRETRGFAKTEHQQAQSESCNVLEASPTFGQSFWIRKSPSRPLLGSCSYRIVKCDEYLQLPTAMGCILMVKVFTIFLFFSENIALR